MTTNLYIAQQYYNSLIAKDFETMSSYLDDTIYFISPLTKLQGKEAVISAAQELAEKLDKINIRAQFEQGDEIMMAYDFIFTKLNFTLRVAVLMNFQNSLITKIELFFDTRPFEKQ
jgi:ketosteroid isomerase-like protein